MLARELFRYWIDGRREPTEDRLPAGKKASRWSLDSRQLFICNLLEAMVHCNMD